MLAFCWVTSVLCGNLLVDSGGGCMTWGTDWSKKQMGPGISPCLIIFVAGNLAGLIASINDNHRGKTGENWSLYIPLDFLSSRFPTWDHRCSPALTVRGLFGTSLKMHSKAHTVIPTYTILYYNIL